MNQHYHPGEALFYTKTQKYKIAEYLQTNKTKIYLYLIQTEE